MILEPKDQYSKITTLHFIALCCLGLFLQSCQKAIPEGAGADWAHYLGHPTSNQYSNLDQINKDNVDELEVAWTYISGDSAMYQTNNLNEIDFADYLRDLVPYIVNGYPLNTSLEVKYDLNTLILFFLSL